MKYYVSVVFLMLVTFVVDAKPEKLASCEACHGANGAAPIAPLYPKLAGQNEAYILASLKSYKAGQRKGGLSAVMSAQASMLSDAEMAELAKYFSIQKP